jgi:S1-C subfamily serine protease
MMVSKFWIAVLASPLLLVAACAPINAPGTLTVTVDGVRYPSAQAALDAQRQTSETSIAALPHEPDPLLGRVQIVLPDRDRLRPFVISLNHGPVVPAAIDYFISLNDMVQHSAANALMYTHAFETSHMIEQNDTTNPDMGNADFIVWHQIYSLNNGTAWSGRWMVRRAGSSATQIAIFDVGTKAYSTAWYGSFVKSVREAALRLGGKTAAGAKASTTIAGGIGTGSGSGIVVDTAGHVLTNNHVVASCQSIHVFDGPAASDATVVARDASNDLALLKIPAHAGAAAAFRDSASLRAGESVVVTGYPLSGLVSSEMSITTGSLTALKGPRDDTRILQISAPIQPGNSGGPALDNDGDVIGVVSSTLNSLLVGIATGGVIPQGVNFAIKTSLVEEFLDSNRVHYDKAGARHEISTPDIADKARKFTVRVECR